MKSLRGFWKFLRKEKKDQEIHTKTPEKDLVLQQEPKQLDLEIRFPFRKKKEKINIQVGIDFGTSCTKIVFSPLRGRIARPIDFNHNLPSYPSYCLPSVAAINEQKRLLLGIDAAEYLTDSEWDTGFHRFKVVLAGKYDKGFYDHLSSQSFNSYLKLNDVEKKCSPEKLTTIFLAHTINSSKKWILSLPEYKDANIDFAFNICMPIEHVENNKVKKVFEKIFSDAEAFSNAWIDLGDELDLLNYNPSPEYYPTAEIRRVFAIPESVAGIASYLVSLRKESGLHAIIDLGAGTTDVSIFNLMINQGETESLWYAARNIPQGMVSIDREIVSYLKSYRGENNCTYQAVTQILAQFSNPKYLSEEKDPNMLKLYLSTRAKMQELKDSEDYYHTWGNAYINKWCQQTKWDHVEIFLSGGGSSLLYAKDIFSKPWWEMIDCTYPVSKLPIPDDYEPGKSEVPFERMTIAYGLSIPKPTFDKFQLPKDSPDQTPPPLRYEWIDRDEIYAK